ncbi:MAG TPA: Gfo/Idh/MocA family oxidoreductase [Chloroflexota bacterium]|nr:Gfo/Idh/MocA family oxidoreductase [Chloroflexota bacterium]
MAVTPVRVAAVGCGYWGPNTIRNLDSIVGFQLCCICDSDPERLRPVAARYPAARPTTDVNNLFDDASIDAVYLSTPVSTHYALVKRALASGKHVLVEKPLATTVEQAEELAALATARSLTLMVGHTFVFSPPVRKVKELIDSGVIGPIYYVETTRVNLGLFQKDVSVLWDLGPHDLSILNYWLGEVPIRVSARGRSFLGEALEDVAFVTLEFPSGILAQVQISWLAPSKLRRTSVVGRERMVVYDDLEPVEKVKVYDRGVDRQPASFGEYQLTYRSGDILSPRLDTTEPLYLECAHFLECIQTGREPDTSPRSGVEVVRVIQAAESSLREGGAPQTIGQGASAAIDRTP